MVKSSELDLYRALSTPRRDAVTGLRDTTRCMILLGYEHLRYADMAKLRGRVNHAVATVFRKLEGIADEEYAHKLAEGVEGCVNKLPLSTSLKETSPVADLLRHYREIAAAYPNPKSQ